MKNQVILGAIYSYNGWLKTQFLPRKVVGKLILVLVVHSTHCTSVAMLKCAEKHEIILLCLGNGTTQFLQSLDMAFFKSLKSSFAKVWNRYVQIQEKNVSKFTVWKFTDSLLVCKKPFLSLEQPEYARLISNCNSRLRLLI